MVEWGRYQAVARVVTYDSQATQPKGLSLAPASSVAACLLPGSKPRKDRRGHAALLGVNRRG